jgi:hypothetical protein
VLATGSRESASCTANLGDLNTPDAILRDGLDGRKKNPINLLALNKIEC